MSLKIQATMNYKMRLFNQDKSKLFREKTRGGL